MSAAQGQVISATESVCPVCLSRITARRVQYGGDVYLEKECPEHGAFRSVIWRGEPGFQSWVRPKTPAYPKHPITEVIKGCPYDCGLCPDHRQQTCHALLEITQRCDLKCPVCYASSGEHYVPDPGLKVIEGWYRCVLQASGAVNIQLSGGEPALRDDLPEIIALGRSLGFSFFQLNTNGMRIARRPEFLERLKEAGLSTVFLQFDGTNDTIYRTMRGQPLFEIKKMAIENCAKIGVGVILVPTLKPGVNDQDIGKIIHFALEHTPTVRGVHFQPVSYFGRYPGTSGDKNRLTIPEIIQRLCAQTDGRVKAESFRPPGCENALCSFHANFVQLQDGALLPLTHHQSDTGCGCKPESGAQGAALARNFVAREWVQTENALPLAQAQGPSLGEWDIVLERRRTHSFYISGMAFQDAWNLDLERLRDCCIHIVSPDGRLVPFCAYNLTSATGETLYRNGRSIHRCS